jgi:hypothetical protein
MITTAWRYCPTGTSLRSRTGAGGVWREGLCRRLPSGQPHARGHRVHGDHRVAQAVDGAQGGGGSPRTQPDVPPMALEDAVRGLPGMAPPAGSGVSLRLLGAIAANRLGGEPVWLLLVDASRGGKTEIVRACGDLAECAHISSLTEAGLLSGTSRSEHADDATGGVLRTIGSRGVIVAKDFTSVLAMEKDCAARCSPPCGGP